MEVIVVKRDGTEVPFDVERISNAIFKAAKSVGGANEITAHKLAYQVAEIIDSKSAHRQELPKTKVGENAYSVPAILQVFNPTKWHVEDIQDIVEKVLIENGHARTAKEYILYRQRRTDVRNMSSALSKTIDSFVISDAADDDEKRENANIDGDSTFGIMLKVGGTVMKDYVMRKCMKEKHALMHRRGEIHYHDMDLSRLCFNCLQIPLDKLLDKGYSTGHGYLRTPSNIQSASALSCIALQSNQNDMFQHHGTFM